jgi:hypothetical protein
VVCRILCSVCPQQRQNKKEIVSRPATLHIFLILPSTCFPPKGEKADVSILLSDCHAKADSPEFGRTSGMTSRKGGNIDHLSTSTS